MWQGLLYLLYLKYTILQGQNTSSDPMSILDARSLQKRAHTHTYRAQIWQLVQTQTKTFVLQSAALVGNTSTLLPH